MKNHVKLEKISFKEALFEIIIAIIFFGVGFIVLKIIGVNALEKDFETIALIGFATLIGLPLLGYLVFHMIKKKLTKGDK